MKGTYFYSTLQKSTKFIINIMSLQPFSLHLIHRFCLRDILLLCLNTDFKRGLDTQNVVKSLHIKFLPSYWKVTLAPERKVLDCNRYSVLFLFSNVYYPSAFIVGFFHLAIPRAWWSLQNKLLKITLCYYVKSGFAVSMAAWSGEHGSNHTLGSSALLSHLQYQQHSSALLMGTLWGLGQHYDLVHAITEAMVVSFIKKSNEVYWG